METDPMGRRRIDAMLRGEDVDGDKPTTDEIEEMLPAWGSSAEDQRAQARMMAMVPPEEFD